MKHISLVALALAFSFNASATIVCYSQDNSVLVTVNDDKKQDSGVKEVRINADVAQKASLEIIGYAHTAKNGKMTILAGDPNDGLDMQINTILAQSNKREAFDSSIDLSIEKKQFKTELTCFQAE